MRIGYVIKRAALDSLFYPCAPLAVVALLEQDYPCWIIRVIEYRRAMVASFALIQKFGADVLHVET